MADLLQQQLIVDTINLINSEVARRYELLPVVASMRSVAVMYWLPVYAREAASEVFVWIRLFVKSDPLHFTLDSK